MHDIRVRRKKTSSQKFWDSTYCFFEPLIWIQKLAKRTLFEKRISVNYLLINYTANRTGLNRYLTKSKLLVLTIFVLLCIPLFLFLFMSPISLHLEFVAEAISKAFDSIRWPFVEVVVGFCALSIVSTLVLAIHLLANRL